MTHYFLKCSVVLQISNFCYSVTLKSFTAFVSVSSYWRNEIFFLSVSITRKLENQLVELVNIKHFKNNNFRIEIGTAVAPLLKADKESGIVVFNGMFWSENQSDCCDRSILGNPGTVVATEVTKHGRKRFLTAPGSPRMDRSWYTKAVK